MTPCAAGALSEISPFRPLRFTPVLDAGPVRGNRRVADVVRVQDVMEEEEEEEADECLAELRPDPECLSNSLSLDASRHIFILVALCSSSSSFLLPCVVCVCVCVCVCYMHTNIYIYKFIHTTFMHIHAHTHTPLLCRLLLPSSFCV